MSLLPTTWSVGAAAVRALYMELALDPKPGLVSFRDSGSHRDMDAGTFMRSLFALRGYFAQIARAGSDGAPFAELETLGRLAEARMLSATRGINTHRGAVFCLGLLCASAGRLLSLRRPLDPAGLRAALQLHWGDALRERAARAGASPPRSHGQHAAQLHGLRSAGDEAADAFPVLFDVTLPALRWAKRAGCSDRRARAHALFATMVALDDTNLVHRGGIEGLLYARRAAREFLAAGGVANGDWVDRARSIHNSFVARNLSPGGSADLLGAACWADAVCSAEIEVAQALRRAVVVR